MYIHDISRDTLTTETYPGDPETVVTPLRSIDEDDECNLCLLYTSDAADE